MKKYTIVSTYPEHGTKNIGDNLISVSTIEAIKHLKGKDIIINKVWRADSWNNVKDVILASDAVIFACLAIRKNMDSQEYPYLNEIIKSGIPYAVIAAGTHLPVTDEDVFNDISKSSLELLRVIAENSICFTTRGYLSQAFCDYHKINSTFSGDIAFYDQRYVDKSFESGIEIKRIAVSDPHYPHYFLPSFEKLIRNLESVFYNSEITVLLHGVNPEIERFCDENGIECKSVYKNLTNGLDIYDEFDLHVGYRVHAHVSALKRRKYSYLLEQDGRGNDYGLTIGRKVSVNSFLPDGNSIINKIKNKITNKLLGHHVNTVAVDYIMSIIVQDSKNSFEKFSSLEDQIKGFNEKCLFALNKLP